MKNAKKESCMTYKFTIFGRLAGINELIAAERTNRYKGASLKRSAQRLCEIAIRKELRGIHIKKPVRITYRFYEKNRKRDLDNISGFAHKVIQDALVATKVIENDGWRNILGYTDEFYVDPVNQRIEVSIVEM